MRRTMAFRQSATVRRRPKARGFDMSVWTMAALASMSCACKETQPADPTESNLPDASATSPNTDRSSPSSSTAVAPGQRLPRPVPMKHSAWKAAGPLECPGGTSLKTEPLPPSLSDVPPPDPTAHCAKFGGLGGGTMPMEHCAKPDGTKHGPFQQRYFCGGLAIRGEYRDGEQCGNTESWFPNGGLQSQVLRDAKCRLHGRATEWTDAHTMSSEEIWLDGERDGPKRFYREDGTLSEEIYFDDGKETVKKRLTYARNGQVTETSE